MASNCLTAKSGNCIAKHPNAENLVGCAAHNLAKLSLLIRQISVASSRSFLYQKVLTDNTCISIPMASIEAKRVFTAASFWSAI